MRPTTSFFSCSSGSSSEAAKLAPSPLAAPLPAEEEEVEVEVAVVVAMALQLEFVREWCRLSGTCPLPMEDVDSRGDGAMARSCWRRVHPRRSAATEGGREKMVRKRAAAIPRAKGPTTKRTEQVRKREGRTRRRQRRGRRGGEGRVARRLCDAAGSRSGGGGGMDFCGVEVIGESR